jgi:16S rRNA (guanine(966)-N(2))-methyltransferase RsmD
VSRGAAHLLAIDSHPRCVQYLKQNIQTLQISEAMQVYKSDCVIYCRNAKNVQYDLIFADPPYHLGFHNELIHTIFEKELLTPDGLVVIEHGKQHDFSAIPQFYACRNFGNVYFSFFKHTP